MSSPSPQRHYEPTWESIRTHPLPSWFDDAKLGVFFHWGLYSVPAWAPDVPDIQVMLRNHRPSHMLAHNPYAEWYLNTMQISDSPTARHHMETYGPGFGYDDFVPLFDEASRDADLGSIADLCVDSGARYGVLTTKHHDGFCLWPSSTPHPTKGRYHSQRDLVGGFTTEMRDRGLRAGLYYSGGFDWPVNDAVLDSIASVIMAAPQDDSYVDYVCSHVRELIERYEPDVLWNDISFPHAAPLASLFAQYYNTVPNGVINDRWSQVPPKFGPRVSGMIAAAIGFSIEHAWKLIPEKRKVLRSPTGPHFDFTTPEYSSPEMPLPRKWEATRGIGHSFGANHAEPDTNMLSTTELVRMFVDIVSKGGNLLIGVGPAPDGSVPDDQRAPLLGLGKWLGLNGAAIYDTRPATTPAATLADGAAVRFTTNGHTLNAILTTTPTSSRVEVPVSRPDDVTGARLLSTGATLDWQPKGSTIAIDLPDALPISPAHTIAIDGGCTVRT